MYILSSRHRNTTAWDGSSFTRGRDSLAHSNVCLSWVAFWSRIYYVEDAMQSVKSIHTPRGLPCGHTSYLRMREDCLTVSLPSIFWKVPSTPLSLRSASLGSPLAQAGWPAAVLGLDGRGWERESLLPLSNRLCRQRDSKVVQEKTFRCRTAAASHCQVHAVFLKSRGGEQRWLR